MQARLAARSLPPSWDMTAKQVKEARKEATANKQHAEKEKARESKGKDAKRQPDPSEDIGGVVRPPADS